MFFSDGSPLNKIMLQINMIRVYQANNLIQAQLLLDPLSHQGISALLLNANAHSAKGALPFTHIYPEIWLHNEADIVSAQQLIKTFEQVSREQTWSCPDCGESLPVSFECCWQCLQSNESEEHG